MNAPLSAQQTHDVLGATPVDGAAIYSIGSTVWPGLSKLNEECGEIVDVLGQILSDRIAASRTRRNDPIGSTLLERLMEETADCSAAISYLLDANPILDVEAFNLRERDVYETLRGSGNEQIALYRLVEACGRAVQVVGKLMGTGGSINHWDGTNLSVRLVDVVAEISGLVAYLLDGEYLIDPIACKKRIETKQGLFWTWHREAEQSRATTAS